MGPWSASKFRQAAASICIETTREGVCRDASKTVLGPAIAFLVKTPPDALGKRVMIGESAGRPKPAPESPAYGTLVRYRTTPAA
jgi:hypothetical protein